MQNNIPPDLKEVFEAEEEAYYQQNYKNGQIIGYDHRKAFEQGLKMGYTLGQQGRWIRVETPPNNSLADKNGEIYVIAAEIDSDVLISGIEKAYYKKTDNTYWVPFMGQQTYPTHYMPLPTPPQK